MVFFPLDYGMFWRCTGLGERRKIPWFWENEALLGEEPTVSGFSLRSPPGGVGTSSDSGAVNQGMGFCTAFQAIKMRQKYPRMRSTCSSYHPPTQPQPGPKKLEITGIFNKSCDDPDWVLGQRKGKKASECTLSGPPNLSHCGGLAPSPWPLARDCS